MNPARYLLRDAEPRDAAAMADLIVIAFSRQPVVTDPPASARSLTPRDVAASLAAGGGLVAEADGIVGSLIWALQEGALHVSRVAVDPAWRRQGIATSLLAAAGPVARRLAADRITLGTRLVLTGNRALFAAAGFREVSLQSHPGYAAPTWVAMERRLSD